MAARRRVRAAMDVAHVCAVAIDVASKRRIIQSRTAIRLEIAARSTAIVLLNQSRIENVSPFKLVDTLKGLTSTQLSNVVTEVLNVYRDRSSSLGFKTISTAETAESRNIRQ